MQRCACSKLLPLGAAAGLLVFGAVFTALRDAEAGGTAGAVGACCVPGAFACVEDISEIECIIAHAGIYQGDGSTCGGPECGGCCLPDESCVGNVPPDGCAALGGSHEPATECTDMDCAVGACCFGDATCQELREADCTGAGGAWKGPDSVCGDFDQDGTDDACESCRSDTNGDGFVNVQDFLNLLADWGPCP